MKNLKNKMLMAVGAVSTGAMMLPVVAHAAEPDLAGALETAVGQVKTDFLGYAVAVVPVALAIGGVVLAIKKGWQLFKSFTH